MGPARAMTRKGPSHRGRSLPISAASSSERLCRPEPRLVARARLQGPPGRPTAVQRSLWAGPDRLGSGAPPVGQRSTAPAPPSPRPSCGPRRLTASPPAERRLGRGSGSRGSWPRSTPMKNGVRPPPRRNPCVRQPQGPQSSLPPLAKARRGSPSTPSTRSARAPALLRYAEPTSRREPMRRVSSRRRARVNVGSCRRPSRQRGAPSRGPDRRRVRGRVGRASRDGANPPGEERVHADLHPYGRMTRTCTPTAG